MDLYLGIDAGGTNTDFAISDSSGNILIEGQSETIHAKQVSVDVIRQRLFGTLDEMLDVLGESRESIKFIFAGLPGYGEFPEVISIFNSIFEEILNNKNYKLGNDSVAGWAGSQAAKPGVNMVLGTGAIAYGMDYKGNEDRSSGWGPYCGDEGSAYWMGREAIFLFGKESDGRVERGPLYDIIKKEFNLENDFDFIQNILDLEDNRTEIAKFSMYLSKAAELGDQEAIKIIEKAAHEASIAIKAVINKLDFNDEDKIYISYSGGVFKIGNLLTDKIEEDLLQDKRLEVLEPILSPNRGSALMALKYSGIEITDEIIENLKG